MNVALMSELMDRPVSTFTIGYEGKEDYNEFQYRAPHQPALQDRSPRDADQPATRCRISCRCWCRLQDEPIADNVCIPLYFLAKLVKDSGTTVVQVGEGADENFLGYWWCEHYRQLDESVYQPARQRQPCVAARRWRR